MTRPRIGVSLSHEAGPPARYALRQEYGRAIEAAGGLFLGLASRPEAAEDLLASLDGVVLTGGADIDPRHFGQIPHETVNPRDISPDRDLFELTLARAAVKLDVPLLAICRGAQVLNVALGGTLVQDVPSMIPRALNHDPGGPRHAHAHDVAVVPGTRLFEILGRRRVVAVNSFHHQAVAKPGEGLVVAARSTADGVIEGIERADKRFVVGVQWHPEGFFAQGDDFGGLFTAFVECCGIPCRA